jgi:hypothetical protein
MIKVDVEAEDFAKIMIKKDHMRFLQFIVNDWSGSDGKADSHCKVNLHNVLHIIMDLKDKLLLVSEF